MTALHTLQREEYGPVGVDETIIASLYDRAQMIMSVFVDDGVATMELTQRIFREAQAEDGISEGSVYTLLAHTVQSLGLKREFLGGLNCDDMLCWLMKETSQMRYADISDATGLKKSQVASSIAEVRNRLLS